MFMTNESKSYYVQKFYDWGKLAAQAKNGLDTAALVELILRLKQQKNYKLISKKWSKALKQSHQRWA